ncbi:hypothetical protein P4129_29015 [Pseudomonas aeruginosa]|nr:hypothetical protein [Pseudomonas aeruginosa]
MRNLRVDARELGNAEDESFYIRKKLQQAKNFTYLHSWEKIDSIERNTATLRDWASSYSGAYQKYPASYGGTVSALVGLQHSALLLIIAMSAFIFLYNGNSTELPHPAMPPRITSSIKAFN